METLTLDSKATTNMKTTRPATTSLFEQARSILFIKNVIDNKLALISHYRISLEKHHGAIDSHNLLDTAAFFAFPWPRSDRLCPRVV